MASMGDDAAVSAGAPAAGSAGYDAAGASALEGRRVRRRPCNTWENASARDENTAQLGRRTRRRRRGPVSGNQGSEEDLIGARRSRLCSTTGCGRRYTKCRHAHCCSLCSVGAHTERCEHKWSRFQAASLRLRVSTCVVPGCERAAGSGHTHCCSLCADTGGAQHMLACTMRQQYVPMPGPGGCSGRAQASTQDPTSPDEPVPMEVDSSNEEEEFEIIEEDPQQSSSDMAGSTSGATAVADTVLESTVNPPPAELDLHSMD